MNQEWNIESFSNGLKIDELSWNKEWALLIKVQQSESWGASQNEIPNLQNHAGFDKKMRSIDVDCSNREQELLQKDLKLLRLSTPEILF